MAIFSDNPTRVLLHDARVWISGIEVTARLTSPVTVSWQGRNGHNTCSFTLSNANNGFILTQANANGEWALGGDPGELSEDIKRWLYQYKNNDELNPVEEETGERRWPLEVNSPIIHALDTVFVVARWPYIVGEGRSGLGSTAETLSDMQQVTTSPTSERRWFPAFKGYVESKPFSEDYTSGHSSLNVSCFDIRALMVYMRVQLNYLITFETGVVSADSTGTNTASERTLHGFDPTIIRGLFKDLQLPTVLSTPLANMSLEQTLQLLIVGARVAGISDEGAINNPDVLGQVWRRLFGNTSNGATAARQLAGVTTAQEDGEDVMYVAGIGRFRNDMGTWRWPSDDGNSASDALILESWHRFVLFGLENAGDLWTDEMVALHGAESAWDGLTAPHAMQLAFLMPSSGSGMRALTEYTKDNGATTRSWTSRLTIIQDYLEKLDYQWFVTGSGDIVVEFPMYDFVPEQFGEFAEAFTLRSDGEVKSASFEDDKPQVPALVSATGAYDPTAVDGNSALFTDAILRGDGLSLTNTRATLYSPIVATRIGMRVERISFPFVTDVCRLRQFATLFFQRKLAEANTLSASFVFRPLITPNRPIHYVARERMAWCQSVDMSLSKQVAHGIPTTSASFRYVRRRDSVTGEYRLITGSSNMPLSFNGSGPGINPQRGILINESYAPGGEIPDPSVNTLCPGDAIIGRPPVTTLLQLQTGSGGLGTVFDPDQEAALGECSTNEEDLTVTAQSLWRELQSYAFSEYALALELICTHNPGSAHESIEPYGHNNSPSPAFDIKITREDGSPGGIDDYVAVGMLGESLGLVWGGALGAGDDTVTRVQSRILERAQWHYNNETPYIWKGNGPPEDVGVDCSGLVVNCYRYAGIFSRTADYSAGTLSSMFPAPVGRDPLPGELVFYLSENGAADGKLASHVTIIAEDGQSVYSARGNQSCTTLDRAAERNAKVVKRDLATYRRSEFTHYGAVFELVAYSSSNLNHFSTESAGPSSGSN